MKNWIQCTSKEYMKIVSLARIIMFLGSQLIVSLNRNLHHYSSIDNKFGSFLLVFDILHADFDSNVNWKQKVANGITIN